MGYDVSLYKIPDEQKDKGINYDMLFDIAYGDDDENYLLIDTNFSRGNPKSVDFAEVFDIILTNNGFFKIYKMSDYHEAKNRLQLLSLDDALQERISKFLNVIERELNKDEIIFFCCS